MYNLSDIKTIHLEITNNCQASCPMCGRNIQGGVDNPFMIPGEISLENFKAWFKPEFIKQLDRLYMCGNLGDPIVAKDTLEVFTYCREENPNITLSMNTNGSARSQKFWEQLAELNVSIRFGIDGLADTHSLYRKGTDFNKIIENARAFINNGGYAIWDMLVFDHNKHQTGACQHLADQMGFKEFNSKNTSRFKEQYVTVLDKTGTPLYKLYGTDRSKEIASKLTVQNLDEPKVTISCKVQQEKSLYVAATGNISPCCWLDMEWMPHPSFSRIDFMDKFGVFKNLHDTSLEEIFNSGFFNQIENTWGCNPLRECSKQCGEIDRFNEQFK